MQNRRDVPRWKIGRKIKLLLDGHDQWNECQLEDINLKGMKVSLPENLPWKNSMRINLALEDGFSVYVEGHPCWEKKEDNNYSYGITFTRVWDEDRDRIYQYFRCRYADQFKENWWRNYKEEA